MSEGSLPSNVHVLKPRTRSLSDRLDEFLQKHALSPNEPQVRCDPTRPNATSINGIRCVSCGKAEYISREYCRCGHYLNGQLEDEYLSWLHSKETAVEKLTLETEKTNKQARWLFCLAISLLLVPLVAIAFFPSGNSLLGLSSFLVALLVAGTACAVENTTKKKIRRSNVELLNSDMTEYLLVRSSLAAESERGSSSNGSGGTARDA